VNTKENAQGCFPPLADIKRARQHVGVYLALTPLNVFFSHRFFSPTVFSADRFFTPPFFLAHRYFLTDRLFDPTVFFMMGEIKSTPPSSTSAPLSLY
jgi:hypothetical protein